MQFKYLKITSVFTVIICLNIFCIAPSNKPSTPFLSMNYVMLSDTTDALDNPVKRFTFSFDLQDEDGNVGLKTEDTLGVFHPDSMFHYNCFLNLFKIENQDTILTELPAPLQYRIPYLEPKGRNKNLDAEVFLNIDMTIGVQTSNYENVMFELFIYDRTFKKSNTIKSPVLPFNGTGIYSSSR